MGITDEELEAILRRPAIKAVQTDQHSNVSDAEIAEIQKRLSKIPGAEAFPPPAADPRATDREAIAAQQKFELDQRQIAQETDRPLLEEIGSFAGQAAAGTGGLALSATDFLTKGAEKFSRNIDPKAVPGRTSGGNAVRRATQSGRDFIENTFGPPLTAGDRFGRFLGEEGAAAAVTAGPLRALARGAEAVGVPVAGGRMASGSVGGLVGEEAVGVAGAGGKIASQSVGRLVGEEALSSVGTAAGRTLAGADASPGEDLAGGLLGSVAGAGFASTIRGADSAFNLAGSLNRKKRLARLDAELKHENFVSVLNPDGSLSKVGQEATDRLLEELGATNRQQAIALIDEYNKRLLELGIDPKAKFSLSAVVDVPGLREEEIRAIHQNPYVSGLVETGKDAGTQEIHRVLMQAGGARNLSGGDAGLAAMRQRFQREMENIDDQARALVPNDGIDIDAYNLRLSEKQEELLHKLYEKSVAEKDAVYQNIEDKATLWGAMWDPAIMKESVERVHNSVGSFELSALPGNHLLNGIRDLNSGGVEWSELSSLQREINDQLRNPNNSKNQNRLLGFLRDGISDTHRDIEQRAGGITFTPRVPEPSAVPGVDEIIGPAAEASRAAELSVDMLRANAIFREHAAMFREGVAGRQLKGNFTLGAPDAYLGKSLHAGRGGLRDGRAFLRTFKNSPRGLRTGNDFLIGEAYRASLKRLEDGTNIISRKKLGQWLKNHAGVMQLDGFRDARKAITDIDGLSAAARRIGVPTINDEITLTDVALRKYLNNPNQVFSQILNSDNPIGDVKRVKGLIGDDADALQGFRRRFWDNIVVHNGVSRVPVSGGFGSIPRVNASAIERVFDNPDQLAILKELYKPDEVKRLRKIADVQRVFDKFPSRVAATPNEPATVLDDVIRGTRRSGLLSPIPGAQRKQFQSFRASREFLREMTQGERDKVIEFAIVNPDLSKILLSAPTDTSIKNLRRHLGTNLLSLPGRVEEREEQTLVRGRANRELFDENGRPIVPVTP